MKQSLFIALTLIFSGFFFLVAGELTLRFYLQNHTIYDVEMTRYSNLIKIASDNPHIAHLHRPSSSARLMNVMVRINSDGFRDKAYSFIKDPSKHRIIFLGDSLTFGWGVDQDKTFESIIENQLNKTYPTEIINFGTGNYNTEQEVYLFREKGLKYNADKVVVFYFINDAELTPQKSSLGMLNYSYVITFYWSKISTLLYRFSIRPSYREYYEKLYSENSPGWENVKKSFLFLKSICKEHGILLQVVLLPDFHNLLDYPFKKQHQMVSAFLEENNIDWLDLMNSFNNYSISTQFWVAKDDAHPNEYAHKLIAQNALSFISKWGGSQ